ncbi:MAG TPA: 4-hydroxy-tetrahydrodipicolinate synthase [Planctomycetota bacterium]|nr:4-hydroxy-tetrahydrodipicolinate synthase [Planctomycetota bacterium]
MFKGSMVAMVTPFKGGRLDVPALRDHAAFLLENGSSALVPIGTTGESPTLTSEERAEVLRIAIKAAKGKAPIVAGTGTNDTRTTIEHTRAAEELGADAILVVTPYYNKPSQEGLFRHFEAVAAATKLPVCLYNVPGRTSVNLLPETVARLSKIRTIAAIKEASGTVDQAARIRELCDIVVVSGDDALTLAMMEKGATGVISVAANVIPRAIADLCAAAAAGDAKKARGLHDRYLPLMEALFLETNPVPVKAALRLMGRGTGEVRLPLCAMSESNEAKLRRVLADFALTYPPGKRSGSGSRPRASAR